jgi:hypothetical protein
MFFFCSLCKQIKFKTNSIFFDTFYACGQLV